MTKQEAKKILYVFLKRHGLTEKYYYNCIMCNYRRSMNASEYFKLAKRERLKRVMDEHCDWFFKSASNKRFAGFFNYETHAFRWRASEEGYDYWEEMFFKWEKEIGIRLLENLEKGND
jgi:hypothetical protein